MQSWGQAPGYGCQFPKDENKETDAAKHASMMALAAPSVLTTQQ